MKFDIFIVLNWADKDSQKGFCASFVLNCTQFVEKSSKKIWQDKDASFKQLRTSFPKLNYKKEKLIFIKQFIKEICLWVCNRFS